MLQGKTVAILVEDDFEDSELAEPLRALQAITVSVVIVGNGVKKTFKGKRGKVVINANASACDVNSRDFDAVIIPGGYAPDKMRLNEDMVNLVRNLYREGKIVAAICYGPQLLITADVVRGKRVTSCSSIAIDLKNAGAEWVDEAVVVCRNLITSRRPADIPQFNSAIIKALKLKSWESFVPGCTVCYEV